MNRGETVVSGTRYTEKKIKSTAPFWGAAAVWALAALIMPMHKISVILLTAAVSAGVYGFIALIAPKKTVREKVPFTSGDEALDDIVNRIDAAMDAVSADSKQIYAVRPEISDTMNQILSYILKIRQDILQNPQKVKKISRFLNYYLPTTVKLSGKYVYLTSQRSKGENVTEAMASVEKAFGLLKEAFIKQHDALFTEEALDLSTDTSVLETLIRQDGLDES